MIVQYMICDCCSHYLVVDMCLVPNEANISHLAPNNEYLGTQEVMSATNGLTCQDRYWKWLDLLLLGFWLQLFLMIVRLKFVKKTNGLRVRFYYYLFCLLLFFSRVQRASCLFQSIMLTLFKTFLKIAFHFFLSEDVLKLENRFFHQTN